MTAGQEQDAGLIVRLAAGDPSALRALYDRYASLLLAVGMRLLGERREAEDVLHDVFLEAWQQAGSYDPARGTVHAWLLLRLRSRCLDRLRSFERARSVPQAERPDRLDASREDPLLAPDRARVRSALRALPEAQRTVLELAYFMGLSGGEVANRLGVPIGTVKTRVALGLAKMRMVMSDTRPDAAVARSTRHGGRGGEPQS